MSATTSSPTTPAAQSGGFDVSGTPTVPFATLVRVELRKTWDTRAGLWLLISIAGLVLLAEVIALLVTIINDVAMDYGSFIGVAAFVTGVLLPVLGIMLVTSEWSQRTAMVTFSLEPRRPRVIAAKALVGVVLTIATIVVALVLGLVCNLIYAAAQGGGDWSFGWNYFVGFFVIQNISMLSGFALAALLLNTPAAIVVYFAYKFVLPGLFGLGGTLIGNFTTVAQWVDFQAAQTPLIDLSISGSQWGHLIVSALVWLGIPLFFGLRRILTAEVK